MKHIITTENCDREYEHGTVEVIKRDGVEKTVRIEIDLVISEDAEDLKEEIQEVIRRYAI